MQRLLMLSVSCALAFLAGQTAIAHAQNPADALGTNSTAQPSDLSLQAPATDFISPAVDHVANGVGLRNMKSGTIRLRGAPASATPKTAILYFGFICTTTTGCPSTQSVSLNGAALLGTLIATTPQPCWAGTTYGAYKVRIPLALISPGINGDYLVAGVPSSLTTGADPWLSPISLPLAEGASLVVVYSDPSLSSGQVYIHDGAQMFFGTLIVNNPLVPPLPPTASRFKLTSIGADGQVDFSTFAIPSISGEKTFIGPSLTTQIAGPNSTQDQDSDWNGNDGRPLNQLWDTSSHSFEGIIPGGSTSYGVKYQSFGDCIVWQAHVLTAR